jgi:hypothetical protein
MLTLNIFESKFGFHPCDREHYKKLKKVRYYNHINFQQQMAHQRWSRKLPHNRVRWQFDGFYDKNALDISFTKWKAIPWMEPEVCPASLILMAQDLIKAYPVKATDDVRQLTLDTETLDAMIEQCEAWLKRIGKSR